MKEVIAVQDGGPGRWPEGPPRAWQQAAGLILSLQPRRASEAVGAWASEQQPTLQGHRRCAFSPDPSLELAGRWRGLVWCWAMLGVPEAPGQMGQEVGLPRKSVTSKHRDQIGKARCRACTFSLLTAPGSGCSVPPQLRESSRLALVSWMFQARLCPRGCLTGLFVLLSGREVEGCLTPGEVRPRGGGGWAGTRTTCYVLDLGSFVT